jgi:predicted peptidase
MGKLRLPTVRATPTPTPTPTPSPSPTPSATPAPTMDGYVSRTYTDASGMSMTYYLHVPSDYDPAGRFPVVLLLHGGGEVGGATASPQANEDLLLSRPYVQVWTSADLQARWPSFVVVPQLVAPNRWVNVPAQTGSYTLQPQPSDSLRLAVEIVNSIVDEYAGVDPGRIYVTGISSGGYGTWEAIERWPRLFAAAVPVSGAGDPSQAAALTHLPIWAFHGSADGLAPVSGSRDMIHAIGAAGGSPCYTEYAGAAHDIWMQVYGDGTMLAWMFAQGTSAASAPGTPRCSV